MTDLLYDIECLSIDHEPTTLAKYRGQVLLIVNTASFCGFSPQYKGLEYLYRTYHSQGFSVLGFPSNDFVQEPFNDQRISDFCVRNYAVSFPMFAKVNVTGAEAAPLFKLLKSKARGWFGSEAIKWNFTKFLIDREGRVVARFGPTTYPRQLRKRIEALLS